jgi:hypothetical protein
MPSSAAASNGHDNSAQKAAAIMVDFFGHFSLLLDAKPLRQDGSHISAMCPNPPDVNADVAFRRPETFAYSRASTDEHLGQE